MQTMNKNDAIAAVAAEEAVIELRRQMKLIENDRDSARQGYVARGECLARVQLEARAIADALGQRGLLDFADDVRMLARLANSV